MDPSFYKSWLSEEIRDQGRAQNAAENILLVLETRGLHVSDEIRERVTDCNDRALLRRWLINAVTASSAGSIFADAGHAGQGA